MLIHAEDKSEESLEFYSQLCRFNYFRDLHRGRVMSRFNTELDELPRVKSEQHSSVPLHFASSQAYMKLWEPLFMEEVRSYIVSASATEAVIDYKAEMVSYFELGNFQILEFKVDSRANSWPINTLLLLSPQKSVSDESESPHLIGLVYKQDSSLYVRCNLNLSARQQEDRQLLTTSKQWYLRMLCSISSVERQLKALLKFEQLDPCLKEIFLHPHENRALSCKLFVIPQNLQAKLRSIYNQSQLQAIEASLKQEGVTLIQGPPGTGKTKTVLGTLSVILQSSLNKDEEEEVPLLLRWKTSQSKIKNNIQDLNPWVKTGYSDWRDEPILKSVEEVLNLTKIYTRTQRNIPLMSREEALSAPLRVLVCGPSNASVDEVIRKMLSEKLIDGEGRSYMPKFVRVGENYHQSLQEHSLDYMANQLIKTEKMDVFNLKKKILRESRLVFTTLSSAGSGILECSELEFDTVVIDEAGQSVELSCLIPLMYGCKRLIMIGDPKQLPATVFSPVCLKNHYDQSLFQRLMKSQYPVKLLKTQYRMHHDISCIIGKTFYQGLLEDGNHMPCEPLSFKSAFVMIHLDNSCELFRDQSYYNPAEAETVKALVNALSKNYDDIGVLSPYTAQVNWLVQQKIAGGKCEIKTIDSFQGREKRVIVFSSVRAHKQGQFARPNRKHTIGFVGDGRRLNVALSRAKDLCVVVGDLHRLKISKVWKSIINTATKQRKVFRVSCAQELRQMGEDLSGLRSLSNI